jgi:hypothetical protein
MKMIKVKMINLILYPNNLGIYGNTQNMTNSYLSLTLLMDSKSKTQRIMVSKMKRLKDKKIEKIPPKLQSSEMERWMIH